MNKNILIVVAGLLLIPFIACNGSSDQEAETTDSTNQKSNADAAKKIYNLAWFNKDNIEFCKNAGGLANFYAAESDAKTMMADFNATYKIADGKPVDALVNSYWLSTCMISEMAAYLDKNKHDGIRIYMGCSLQSDAIRYKNQFYQNTSTIFIFPTNLNTTIPATGPKSRHVTDINSKLHLKACVLGSDYFKDYKSIAKDMINKFDGLYRKIPAPGETADKRDALSQSVWVDACVIKGLNELLLTNSKTNDGVFIYLGCYKNIAQQRARFQKYDLQSTALIIPSMPDGIGHLPDWNLVDQIFPLVKSFAPPGGFNHGELCPQVCD